VNVLTLQGLKESACTPLFWNAFTMRNAGACIHTHSQHAVLLTLLLPRTAPSFRISHQEMIKGVRLGGVGKTLRFFDTLEIPIIENTADEEDLTDGMAKVCCVRTLSKSPLTCRQWKRTPMQRLSLSGDTVSMSGVHLWAALQTLPHADHVGNTWEQAKTQAECLDYLFEMATKMLIANIPLTGLE
jgi:methylthioribulose-1-phosphate dehydratase